MFIGMGKDSRHTLKMDNVNYKIVEVIHHVESGHPGEVGLLCFTQFLYVAQSSFINNHCFVITRHIVRAGFNRFTCLFYVCVHVCLSVCMGTTVCRGLQRPEEGVGYPGTEIIGSSELTHVGARNQT